MKKKIKKGFQKKDSKKGFIKMKNEKQKGFIQ
jgi:hypothetical protein